MSQSWKSPKDDVIKASIADGDLSDEAIAKMTVEEKRAEIKLARSKLKSVLGNLIRSLHDGDNETQKRSDTSMSAVERLAKFAKMSVEQQDAAEKDIRANLYKSMDEFLAGVSDKTNQQPVISPNQHTPASKKASIWTVECESASFRVPIPKNARRTSKTRGYHDDEVTHGFPVKNLKEFFFHSYNIVSAGYDPDNRRLFLKFGENCVYQYFDVPEEVVLGLINASSHGRYASRNIYRSFKYERI